MNFKINHNGAEVNRAMLLSPVRARKALSASLNRTAAKANTATSREIRADFNIKASALSKAVKVRKSTRELLRAVIVIRGKRIPRIEFGARPSEVTYPRPKIGVSVKIKKAGGRAVIPHSFIARMKSGHIGVFLRKNDAGRLPVEELVGPSVPHLFKMRKAWAALTTTVRREMPIEWARAWKFFGG